MKNWYDIDGWFNHHDAHVYHSMVEYLDNGSTILEIGAYKGRSTICLAQTIIASGKDIKIHVVDTFEGDGECGNISTYQEFMTNMLPYANLVELIRKGESTHIAETNTYRYGGVYIDASHDYKSVSADIKAWLPFIKIGGVMGGHDYNFASVRMAVDENFTEVISLGNSWLVLL
jgi:cephalosporin hydroxylase